MLSQASLKNNKHLNILSSQLNEERKKQVGITRANSFIPVCACGMRRGGWDRASILSVMPNAAPDTYSSITVFISVTDDVAFKTLYIYTFFHYQSYSL